MGSLVVNGVDPGERICATDSRSRDHWSWRDWLQHGLSPCPESHVRQLAIELGHMDIGVSAIMAGVTDTPALRKIPGNEEMIKVAEIKNPRERLTTPEDVAKVISLLSRDGGEWISGGMINADGGEDIVSFTGKRQ